MLDGPHPMVPADLVPRATLRGRRLVRRRRAARQSLWALLCASVLAGIVLAVLFWPDDHTPADDTDGTWWAPPGAMAPAVPASLD